jgi:hypothetical protein
VFACGLLGCNRSLGFLRGSCLAALFRLPVRLLVHLRVARLLPSARHKRAGQLPEQRCGAPKGSGGGPAAMLGAHCCLHAR